VLAKTPDINVFQSREEGNDPAETDSFFTEFGVDGFYFVYAAVTLDTNNLQTIVLQLLINGTVVFDTVGIHTENTAGRDAAPKEQSAITILKIKAGDRLQVRAVGSASTPLAVSGTSLTVLRLRQQFAHLFYNTSQSGFTSANAENIPGKLGSLSSAGDITTVLSENATYDSATGYLNLGKRPNIADGHNGPAYFLITSLCIEINSTAGNGDMCFRKKNASGTETDITGVRECTNTEVGSSDDPMEKSWSCITDPENGDGDDFSYLVYYDPDSSRRSKLNKGTSMTVFDISFDDGFDPTFPEGLQAIPQFEYAFAGQSSTISGLSGNTITLFKTADGGSPSGVSGGISYSSTTGKFTFGQAVENAANEGASGPIDGYPQDYFISLNLTMPASTTTTGDHNKVVNVIKNGTEIIHSVTFIAENIIDDGFDCPVNIIAPFASGDTVEFQFVNQVFSGIGGRLSDTIVNIFRVSDGRISPPQAERVHFGGAQDLFPEDGIINTTTDDTGLIIDNSPPVPPLVETDNTINTHEKQNQRYRVVEQAPYRLGVNGPLSLRGRIGGVKPFNVGAGKRGGKK
tara:strand:- start:403 stop:2124 length:1722 start_codon:yes stop_codon:yes gene_type:complete